MKKKGFTLIELLAVIIILAVIAVIATPMVNGVIKKSKNKAYEEIKANILEAAYNYSIYNELGYNSIIEKILTLDEIRSKGYLENQELIDPRDNSKIEGCVLYKWDASSNQYNFEFDEECNPENLYPEITIDVKNSVNSAGWINDYLTFEVKGDPEKGEYQSYRYCVGENNCKPNMIYQTTVTSEKTGKDIYVCATGYADDMEGKSTCTKAYNVDPEKPSLKVNSITPATGKIVISATCSDEISGVKEILYSNDNGSTWNSGSNSYVFSNLTSGTYKVRVKCVDNALNETYDKDIATDVQVITIEKPEIVQIATEPTEALTSGGWAKRRIYRITYNGDGEYYFKSTTEAEISSLYTTVDSGIAVSSCGTGTVPGTCTSSSETNLESGVWYKTNRKSLLVQYKTPGELYSLTMVESEYKTDYEKVVNIDYTAPTLIANAPTTTTDSISIPFEISDLESGISYDSIQCNIWKSGYSKTGTVTNNNTCTFTNLEEGTQYNVSIIVYDNVGNFNGYQTIISTERFTAPNIVQVSQSPSNTTWARQRILGITFYNTNVTNPTYYIKSTATSSYSTKLPTVGTNIITASCGTDTIPTTCTNSSVTTLQPNTWYKVNTTSLNVSYVVLGELYAVTMDGSGNVSGSAYYNVTNIDSTAPSIAITNISTTSTSITVSVSCTDAESGVSKYQYTNGDITRTYVTTSASHSNIFTSLTTGQAYNIKVTCWNGAESYNYTETIETPPIVENPYFYQIAQTPTYSTYVRERDIGVRYYDTEGLGTVLYFKSSINTTTSATNYVNATCGTGTTPGTCSDISTDTKSIAAGTWYRVVGEAETIANTVNNSELVKTSYFAGLTYTQDADIEAVVKKGDQVVGKSYYKVVNMDTQPPTVAVSVSGKIATITMNDNLMLSEYGVDGDYESLSGTNATRTYTATSAGTYTVDVQDDAGRTATTSFTIDSSNFCEYAIGHQWTYAYNGTNGTDGSYREFTSPCKGTYKLEVYGAQGGATGKEESSWGETIAGGLGGYSQGNIGLSKTQKLYVVVGGQPANLTPSTKKNFTCYEYDKEAEECDSWYIEGGYNGGGASIDSYNNGSGSGNTGIRIIAGAGGGATHIATSLIGDGTLDNYSSSVSNILIVAGGGGGSDRRSRWYFANGGKTTITGGAGGGVTSGQVLINSYTSCKGYDYDTGECDEEGTFYNKKDGIILNNAYFGTSANQTSGSAFGQGDSNSGGGWYGGNYFIYDSTKSGTGGSGYIGGVTGGSMQNGIREGHGYAVITLVSID